jgi:hypothetical protein
VSDGLKTTRATFVRGLAAIAAVVALDGCDDGNGGPGGPGGPGGAGSAGTGGGNAGAGGGGGVGNELAWATIPELTFVQGVASSISIADYVPVAALPLTITKNDVALPPGVTFDAGGLRFVYDGVGEVGSTPGHVLSADDGA